MVCFLEKQGESYMKKGTVTKILLPLTALLLCGVVVMLERYGVTSKYIESNQGEAEELVFSAPVSEDAACLILTSEKDNVSAIYEEMITFVLEDMRVVYDVLEVQEDTDLSCLKDYDTLVLAFEDWSVLGDNLLAVCDWVKAGGAMMNMSTPVPNASFLAVSGKLGIESGGTEYVAITGFQVMNDCMMGGKEGEIFWYSDDGTEELETSLNVCLNSQCEVLFASEDGSVPLIWKCKYGDGSFVITNEVITDKYQRGFVSLAYSKLEDACIYPVINASAFYLDDFPSPVPEGNGEYIRRDYGVSIASFYSTIWWPQVLSWGEKYQIPYTGLIIEKYSDDVEVPFEKNEEVAQFTTFGNMLLNAGGELGFHGYNHMPLCIEGIDEGQQYGAYELWASAEDVKAAMRELNDFSSNLFPGIAFQVYVPPSNILSESGMTAMLEACPDVNIIASTYFNDSEGKAFEQEFEVDENGVIHTPRIVSALSLTNYQKVAALAELNYHYVQSHFMHPDDLLDEERGAEIGFPTLKEDFESYLEWIYTSAPGIRNVTGSEMGTAVLQYDKMTIDREWKNDNLMVRIGGFAGSAEFLLRVNEGTIAEIDGATYEQVANGLYAVHAETDELKIYFGE